MQVIPQGDAVCFKPLVEQEGDHGWTQGYVLAANYETRTISVTATVLCPEYANFIFVSDGVYADEEGELWNVVSLDNVDRCGSIN
jgi:hypothetical protein